MVKDVLAPVKGWLVVTWGIISGVLGLASFAGMVWMLNFYVFDSGWAHDTVKLAGQIVLIATFLALPVILLLVAARVLFGWGPLKSARSSASPRAIYVLGILFVIGAIVSLVLLNVFGAVSCFSSAIGCFVAAARMKVQAARKKKDQGSQIIIRKR